jgi:hypothetical protein
MVYSFKESHAIAELAAHLCDYLPGSGDPSWKGHVSFKSLAEKVGVGGFWQTGSKLSMVTALLERTWTERNQAFERLVLEVVRGGIVYRRKKGTPLTPDDIDVLNGVLVCLGVKYPDLWDPEFRDTLRIDLVDRAKVRTTEIRNETERLATAQQERSRHLSALQQEFFSLHAENDRWKAGYALERILNRLFTLEGLAPREPFRVVGEQIDGSFELDHETYLIEAKWEKGELPEGPLLVFRGKMEGKSLYTRGVFISLSGISEPAREAIVRGKQPTFFVVNGHDLAMILGDQVGLKQFLRQRRRILAEEGHVCVPYLELWKGSRA